LESAGFARKKGFQLTTGSYQQPAAPASEKSQFFPVPGWIAKRRDLPPAAKLLAGVLAYRSGRNSSCWPGVRSLARDSGLSVEGAIQALRRLETAGFLQVERQGSGKANRYRLAADDTQAKAQAPKNPERPTERSASAQDTVAPKNPERPTERSASAQDTVAPKNPERPTKYPPSAQQSCAQAPKNPEHKRREQEENKKNIPTGAAEPPTPEGDGSHLNADGQGYTPEAGECGKLVALWAKGYRARLSRPMPSGERGRVVGVLKNLLASFPPEDLAPAVGRWWGADRPDFGIALFRLRLEGGAADLTGRKMGGGRGTYPAAPAGGSVSDLVDKRFAGAGR
jgi:hypothetical protein